jgi:hypothetical protein
MNRTIVVLNVLGVLAVGATVALVVITLFDYVSTKLVNLNW